jgi:hypothetical protein
MNELLLTLLGAFIGAFIAVYIDRLSLKRTSRDEKKRTIQSPDQSYVELCANELALSFI